MKIREYGFHSCREETKEGGANTKSKTFKYIDEVLEREDKRREKKKIKVIATEEMISDRTRVRYQDKQIKSGKQVMNRGGGKVIKKESK